ncbi:hypothetical protein PGB90_005309 [Kerria lacca]
MGICLILQYLCQKPSPTIMVPKIGSNYNWWTKYSARLAGINLIGWNHSHQSCTFDDNNYMNDDTYIRATYDIDYKDNIIDINNDNRVTDDDKNKCENKCQENDIKSTAFDENVNIKNDNGLQINNWNECQYRSEEGSSHINWNGNNHNTKFNLDINEEEYQNNGSHSNRVNYNRDNTGNSAEDITWGESNKTDHANY